MTHERLLAQCGERRGPATRGCSETSKKTSRKVDVNESSQKRTADEPRVSYRIPRAVTVGDGAASAAAASRAWGQGLITGPERTSV